MFYLKYNFFTTYPNTFIIKLFSENILLCTITNIKIITNGNIMWTKCSSTV